MPFQDPGTAGLGKQPVSPSRTSLAPTSKDILSDRSAIVALSFAVLYAALPVTDLAHGSAGTRCCLSGLFLSGPTHPGL